MPFWSAAAILLLACGGGPTPSIPPRKSPPPSDIALLHFVEGGVRQIPAGTAYQFRLIDELQNPARGVHVTLSIEPNDGHIMFNDRGFFMAGLSTPEGSTYEITANVDSGARILRQRAVIFHPGLNPFLIDTWKEVAEVGCDGVVHRPPEPQPLLGFRADGTFWFLGPQPLPPDAGGASGRYSYDESRKTVTLTMGKLVANGVYEIKGVGRRELAAMSSAHSQPSELTLRGIPFETWFRTSRSEPCARMFRATPFVR